MRPLCGVVQPFPISERGANLGVGNLFQGSFMAVHVSEVRQVRPRRPPTGLLFFFLFLLLETFVS